MINLDFYFYGHCKKTKATHSNANTKAMTKTTQLNSKSGCILLEPKQWVKTTEYQNVN